MKSRKLFLIALLFSWGCSGVGVQKTPTFYHLDSGKATNYQTITVTDVNAFAPTTTVKFVLHCEPDGSETEMPRCRPSDVGSKDSTPGVITGLGSSVINSAAIVGSGYLIGKGLADSGDVSGDIIGSADVTNDNSVDSSVDNSEDWEMNFNDQVTYLP